MLFEELQIPGVFLITPAVYGDERGFFMESYNQDEFIKQGINIDFIQDNISSSTKNVLRGLHFQLPPFAQDKLVRVITGAVRDVVVDIRSDSETFGRHIAVELNSDNKQALLVPCGCAHGFLSLTDKVIFTYKVSNKYSPEYDRGIIWNDPDLAVDWGSENPPILSAKDAQLPAWSEVKKILQFENI